MELGEHGEYRITNGEGVLSISLYFELSFEAIFLEVGPGGGGDQERRAPLRDLERRTIDNR